MRSPLPRQAVTGTCDGSGNATITNQIAAPASFWALIYVPVQVSAGTPNWSVQLGSTATAQPLIYGSGQQTMLGPFLLVPNEKATLVVTGAAPAATILGQALGWQADDPSELLSNTPTTAALLNPSGAPFAFNVSQIAGTSLSGWPLPNGTRWEMSTNATGLAIGTYTFDVPLFVNPFTGAGGIFDMFTASGTLIGGHAGLFPSSGRAVLYCTVSGGAAGGTVALNIQDAARVDGGVVGNKISTGSILSTTALAIGGSAVLRVAPGLPATANATANDLIGLAPRVQAVVATNGPMTFGFTLDLL